MLSRPTAWRRMAVTTDMVEIIMSLHFIQYITERIKKLEIRSVEHGICPIAEFTSPQPSCAEILAIRP